MGSSNMVWDGKWKKNHTVPSPNVVFNYDWIANGSAECLAWYKIFSELFAPK